MNSNETRAIESPGQQLTDPSRISRNGRVNLRIENRTKIPPKIIEKEKRKEHTDRHKIHSNLDAQMTQGG